MKDKQKVFRAYAMITQLGISILVPVLLCTVLGYWIEDKFSYPVFVPLILLGVAAGVRNAWVMMRQVLKDMDDKKKQD